MNLPLFCINTCKIEAALPKDKKGEDKWFSVNNMALMLTQDLSCLCFSKLINPRADRLNLRPRVCLSYSFVWKTPPSLWLWRLEAVGRTRLVERQRNDFWEPPGRSVPALAKDRHSICCSTWTGDAKNREFCHRKIHACITYRLPALPPPIAEIKVFRPVRGKIFTRSGSSAVLRGNNNSSQRP